MSGHILPDGWKSVPIGEILTDEQLERVLDIINHNRDAFKRIKQLKAYLNTLPLEQDKGILPDFLAYSIEAKLQGII